MEFFLNNNTKMIIRFREVLEEKPRSCLYDLSSGFNCHVLAVKPLSCFLLNS